MNLTSINVYPSQRILEKVCLVWHILRLVHKFVNVHFIRRIYILNLSWIEIRCRTHAAVEIFCFQLFWFLPPCSLINRNVYTVMLTQQLAVTGINLLPVQFMPSGGSTERPLAVSGHAQTRPPLGLGIQK